MYSHALTSRRLTLCFLRGIIKRMITEETQPPFRITASTNFSGASFSVVGDVTIELLPPNGTDSQTLHGTIALIFVTTITASACVNTLTENAVPRRVCYTAWWCKGAEQVLSGCTCVACTPGLPLACPNSQGCCGFSGWRSFTCSPPTLATCCCEWSKGP